jgi:hypothetical protein
LTFDAAGKTLYFCNGTKNAIATLSFRPGRSKLRGLIPVGWFPGAVVHDAPRQTLHVANIKGVGSGRRTTPEEPRKFNSHQYFGSLSLVPIPPTGQLVEHTRQVLANCRRELLEAAQLPPRPDQPRRPVPERTGEPSLFEHVVYRDFIDQTGLIQISSRPAIESLRPVLCTNTVGWDMDIPDLFRADQFIRELKEFERLGHA